MNRIGVLLFLVPGLGLAAAAPPPQKPAIENIAEPRQPLSFPLYANAEPGAKTENWTRLGSTVVVRNVTTPTLTPVLPSAGKATGAAVILAPGGGSIMIALEGEGWPVAQALAARGIAVFVLKYRLVATPPDTPGLMAFFGKLRAEAASGKAPKLENAEARADVLHATELVRSRARDYGIDPSRVGTLGFSTGGFLARDSALTDNAAARPNFVGIVYGGMDRADVPATAPPLFAAVAIDDPIAGPDGFQVVEAWRAAHRPVELHAYQSGGHGFVLGKPGTTTSSWLDQFVAWMDMQNFLKAKAAK